MNLDEQLKEVAQPFKNGVAKAKQLMEDSGKEVDGLTPEEIDAMVEKQSTYILTDIVDEIYNETKKVLEKHNLPFPISKEAIKSQLKIRLTAFALQKIMQDAIKENKECNCEHCKCEKSSITVDEKGNLKNENNI